MERWLNSSSKLSFRLDLSGFMGIPQGICVLAGIDPEASASGDEGFGWYLLPGALESFLCEKYPCSNCQTFSCATYPQGFGSDYDNLLDAVERRLAHFNAMGFEPVMNIRNAVQRANACGLMIPWLRTEFIKTKFLSKLPIGALENRPKFPGEIFAVRSNAGNASAAVNDANIIMQTEVAKIFQELQGNEFQGLRFVTSRKVNMREVAREIVRKLDPSDLGNPQEDQVYDFVRARFEKI